MRRYLVLSSNPSSHSTKRIIEEGISKGHQMTAAEPKDFCIHLDNNGDIQVLAKREDLAGVYNGVIPRGIGNDYGLALLKSFNYVGIPSPNRPKGIITASNKLDCQIELSNQRIRQPKATSIFGPDVSFKDLVNTVGGLPCVSKPWKGSQGDGINIFINPYQSSVSLSNMKKSEAQVLLQEFIETSENDDKKSDLRLFVIDGKVVAAYKRYSTRGDFRSNYSLSKEGVEVEPTEEEIQMAEDSAKAIGLGIAGIDIARDSEDDNKPYLIEANSSPGLTGVESVTKVNIAGLIIDFMDDIADSMEPTKPNGSDDNVKAFANFKKPSNSNSDIIKAINDIKFRLSNNSKNNMNNEFIDNHVSTSVKDEFIDHHKRF